MAVGGGGEGVRQEHDELAGSGMVQPQVDTFQYRHFSLPNGLRCLVISDPDTDKAAASMDVGVGSLLDPPDFLGLAHFTEHMLFYSSAKYPVEDEYSKYVTDHGGHTNAYTASENTNYSFDINWDALAPALDRFAQFFICPLISVDGVDREINAVDSEHGKNLQLDAWRQLQVAKHTANPDHPWARFATGNLATLGTTPKSKGLDIRQAVVDFHAKHYSSNLMRLAVMGRQPVAELQQLVEQCFAGVPNCNLPVPSFPSDVFLAAHRQSLCKIVPVKDVHACEWVWQVPPSAPLYRTSPSSYLSHLLGHEGEGSVYALLRQQGWASSLVSGESGSSLSCTSFFFVRVELTEEGQQHVAEIGAIIFSYLWLVGQQGIRKDLYDEVEALSRLRFDFRDKQAPYAYTTSLSAAMQHYPPEDLLLALYHVPLEYDPEAIRQVLQEMTVDKVRMTWTSPQHASDATDTEPWYGTRFCRMPIPADWLSQWQQAGSHETLKLRELHLPEPNPFIPTDLSLRTQDAAAAGPGQAPGPQLLQEVTGSLRMWHRCDLTFPMPKAVLYADFQCPDAYTSPQAAVCTRLVVKLVADALSELSYPAELAGLNYEVQATQTGMKVMLSGYNHKLPVLLAAVLDNLAQLQVKPDRCAVMVEQLRKEYSNMRFSQPYSWAMYRRELLLNLKRWRVEEYQQVLPGITPDSLQAFKSRLFAQCFVEALYVGNVSQSDAHAVSTQLLDCLQGPLGAQPVFSSQMRDLRAVRLPTGGLTVVPEQGPDPQNVNSAVSIIYQVGPDDEALTRNALLELLVHMGKRDAFNVLRTQQQLGYVVHMFANHELGVQHLEFIIQSSVYGPEELLSRVDGFVQQLVADILPAKCGTKQQQGDGVSADEWRSAVDELSKALLEKPKRLGELAHRWWSAIFFGTFIFDRPERIVSALQALQPQQLVEAAHQMLLDPHTRRKAVVAVYGCAAPHTAAQHALSDSAAQPTILVTDVAEFRQCCEVWPSLAGLYSLWRKKHVALPAPAASEQLPQDKQQPAEEDGAWQQLHSCDQAVAVDMTA